ncbi:MAG: DUF3298 and DUF4163 domain-containing protein [Oscillospiraceae bacterium]|nr:DUF3298 and DUF4163 domain-containing protein [Oscillospiraceae bacterium]
MEITKENIKTVTVAPEYIKKTLKFKDADVLQINIKYPDIKILPSVLYQKSENKINNFYGAVIKNFINFCEKKLYKNAAVEFTAYKNNSDNNYNNKFKPFGAVITFEITYNKQDLLGIYLDINIYVGKGRGNTVRKTHIWKLDGGELLSPERFIKFTRPVKNKICRCICDTMKNQIERRQEYYIISDMPSVYRYLNVKNFYLSENGYSFFFPQNTIAPVESGIISFELPEKVISAFLSSNKKAAKKLT